MKKLQEFIDLLKEKDNFVESQGDNLAIENISYDSRDVQENTLFFCKGLNFKDEYLVDAKEKGANSYISEKKMNVNMPYIIVKDVRKAMMEIARFFYDFPDTKIKTIGVTGTKGKSSTVKYVKSILDSYLIKNGKKPAGIISTINTFDGIEDISSSLTTPEAIMLYRYLNNAVNAGLEYMVIESSSQAFKYDRMNNIDLDVAVFLNIGEDHVSDIEHPTFEDYFNSKLKIFERTQFAIYNKDADHIEKIERSIQKNKAESESFSTKVNAEAKLIDYSFLESGLKIKLDYKGEEIEVKIHQLGTYNIENVLAAVMIAKHFGVDNESIKEGLDNTEISGREEVFESNDKKYIMFVSYAHNELSFDKAYEFIEIKYPEYKIVSIFGNSGKMAKNRIEGNSRSAAKHSDHIIIVPEDSEYTEYDVVYERLAQEIGKYTDNFERADSREDGIKKAFNDAKDKTVFFVAGKGSEDYQKEYGKYIPIKSDTDVARDIIEEYNNK
ncbi:Mur ligase family protein [Helcococcus kunzii]|uniref:Mur ligase family protein n=1 Tax=Helcococcus kunzii TaxID=40091 RepID=UPI0024AD371F|nr:UDP-N-acetylmuramyl-tripeptide synthetase [Helcococcus kunzii]